MTGPGVRRLNTAMTPLELTPVGALRAWLSMTAELAISYNCPSERSYTDIHCIYIDMYHANP